MKTLRPHQAATLAVLGTNSSGLVGSGLGSGKTLIGVERIRQLKERPPRVVIVAPLNTHSQWEATLKEQFPSLVDGIGLYLTGTPHTDPETWQLITSKAPGIFVIGWEAMRGDLPKAIKADKSRSTKRKPPVTLAAVDAAMKAGHIPPWHKSGTWDLVILDESHRISSAESLTKKVVSRIKAKKKLAMSATAAGNTPEGLWSTLNWLWPDQYTSFWRWAGEFMAVEEKHISRDQKINIIVGEIDPGQTWKSIPCAVRYRTEDIADQLPEVIERVITVPMDDNQRRVYDEFEQQALAWIDEQPEATPLPLTQRIRLRQAALGNLSIQEVHRRKTTWVESSLVPFMQAEYDDLEIVATETRTLPVMDFSDETAFGLEGFEEAGIETKDVEYAKVTYTFEEDEIGFNEYAPQNKIKAVKDILKDLPEDEPVIIYTHSSKWAEMATVQLDSAGIYGEVRSWTGKLTAKQRDGLKNVFGKMAPAKMRSAFSHTGIRILIAVIPAVAEGIDGWQHVCRCEIWVSKSEDGLMNEQAKGRLHRPGQKTPVQRWLIHSEDSIDADVEKRLAQRRAQMRTFYGDTP